MAHGCKDARSNEQRRGLKVSEIIRDLILICMGANLTMFAGGAFLGSDDLMLLALLNIIMLGVGISIRDHLREKEDSDE